MRRRITRAIVRPLVRSILAGAVLAFNPAVMFGSGATPGVFLDANDWGPTGTNGTGVVYSDSMTPVTAMEQPVQLVLDKSQGLALGADQVGGGTTQLNGTATAATYNTTTGAGSVTRGASAANQSSIQFVLSATSFYQVTIAVTSGTVFVRDSFGGAVLASNYAVGTNTAIVIGSATLSLTSGGGNATTAAFSSVSIKKIAGNHAYVGASANRCLITARYNLLTKTEQLNDAAYQPDGITISANAIVAPDGALTADKMVEAATTGSHRIFRTTGAAVTSGVQYTVSNYYSPAERSQVRLQYYDGVTNVYPDFDLAAVSIIAANGAVSPTITRDAVTGWIRVTFKCTAGAATTNIYSAILVGGSATYAGDITKGLYSWGFDLRPSVDATGLIPGYQRINTASDYDWSPAFPPIIKGNGANQFLQGTLDLSSTNKVTMWAGFRIAANTDAYFFELSASSATNNGSFNIESGLNDFYLPLRGSLFSRLFAAGAAVAPQSMVLSMAYDLAAATAATQHCPQRYSTKQPLVETSEAIRTMCFPAPVLLDFLTAGSTRSSWRAKLRTIAK